MLVSFCCISYTRRRRRRRRRHQKRNIDNHFLSCNVRSSFFLSDVQRRIELIQDFEMPTVSTSIKVSRDGQYILAAGNHTGQHCLCLSWAVMDQCTLFVSDPPVLFSFPSVSGTYKPRIRCYDTYHLSLKFERCLDSESKSGQVSIGAEQFNEHPAYFIDTSFFFPISCGF